MIKILHIMSCLELGGTEKFVMNVYRNIDRKKFHFDFYLFLPSQSSLIEEIKKLGGNVYFGTTPSIMQLKKFYKSLSQILKQGQYDAVHCHVDDGNAFPLNCARKLRIKNRIAHSHGSNFMCGTIRNKLVFLIRRVIINRSATHYFACSKIAGNDLFGKKLFERKGKIIKNGLDLEEYLDPPIAVIEKLKTEFTISKENEYVLGNITRFDDNKNQIFILEVFKEFLTLCPRSILLLGGTEGDKYEQTVKRAQDLNIISRVRFIGTRQDVPACLGLIDAYIIASKHEGLSIVALEAQASKKQCIASDSLPYETNMGIGNIKYLSLNDSAKKWAEEIAYSLQNRKSIDNQKVINAFEEKGFEIKTSVKELEGVYER